MAVLHCTKRQPLKVTNLGIRLRDGLYAKPLVFPSPPKSLAAFNVLLDAAIKSSSLAKGGGVKDTANQRAAVLALFEVISELRDFVNRLHKGNKVNILASGFDTNKEASLHGLPEIPVIKYIALGPGPHCLKIHLVKRNSETDAAWEKLTYMVQVAFDPDLDENFKTVLVEDNQYKLILTNLTRGKEIFIRIAAKNARGWSDWSSVHPFIPQ